MDFEKFLEGLDRIDEASVPYIINKLKKNVPIPEIISQINRIQTDSEGRKRLVGITGGLYDENDKQISEPEAKKQIVSALKTDPNYEKRGMNLVLSNNLLALDNLLHKLATAERYEIDVNGYIVED